MVCRIIVGAFTKNALECALNKLRFPALFLLIKRPKKPAGG